MNEYELTILSHKDIDQVELRGYITDKIKELRGDVVSFTDEGVKRLAYAINGEEMANYTFYDLRLPQDAPVKLSSWLNTYVDDVLRYLLVKTDERRQTRATTPRRPSNYNLNGSWE